MMFEVEIMGFWIWWLKQIRFTIFLIILLISVAIITFLGFFVNVWYFAFPIGAILILGGILFVDWLWNRFIKPFRKYIQSEKERYKKTLK